VKRSFLRHFAEMVIAMVVGMMTLYPLWEVLTGNVEAGWLTRPEVKSLVMATTMVIPMALWMRFRGHSAAVTVEMGLAMYGGFVVLFPLLWWGGLGDDDLLMLGHVLMLVFMIGSMLLRWQEYGGHHPTATRRDVSMHV
jgi:hypothetical protein